MPKLLFVGIKSVIEQDEKVLLLEKAGATFWEFPGGRIDGDESIPETLKRELNEELPGIKNIRMGELITAERIQRDVKPDISIVLLFYLVSADVPKELSLSDEHSSYKWLTVDEALKITKEANQVAVKALKQQGII